MHMTRKNSLLLILAAAVLAGTCGRADDWPNWRGPTHNGISKESGWQNQWPEGGPKIAWRSNVGTGFSSLAISDGRLFTIGNESGKETVHCLAAESGKPIWKSSYDCPLDPNLFEGGPTSTPTVDGNSVYTISRQGQLFCFDAADGTIRWSRLLGEDPDIRIPGWGLGGSPLIDKDLLILNVGEGGMALDKTAGATVWASASQDSGYSTPLPFEFKGEDYVALSSEKNYLAVNANTGEELWRHRWMTRFGINASDPIIQGEHVFISTGYRKGATLLKWTGGYDPEVVWKEKTMNNQFNSSVLLDGFIYGIDGDSSSEETTLKCVDFMTGEERWAFPGIGAGSLMAADGKLIVLSATGELLVAPASPNGFEPMDRAQVLNGKCWTVPVLANGRIYCRNANGDLVSVDVGGK